MLALLGEAGGLIWGGEGINMGVGPKLEARLRQIGQPALIVADIDLGAPHWAYCLGQVFVGIELALDDAVGELQHFVAVPPADVVAVLKPGSPWYDAFPLLPR